jgi:pyruvate formate lyase activating enzyme
MITGRILHFQRLSTEDGPGIRTTVFFKGCPLHCAWCHNPESMSMQLQTQWFAVRCIGCKTCVDACPNGCITMTESGPVLIRERCDACGKCVDACPSGAREMMGKDVSVYEALAELVKDRAFYEKSGGGVTLSGGEPTFQPDFSEALLCGLKQLGISTALDTCGLTSARTLERLLPHTDLILFDMKIMDADKHRAYTGASNQIILENLAYIHAYLERESRNMQLWIRTPLIPGATDTDENLSAIGHYLANHLDGAVARWELCAFNNLCRDQYLRLGLEWEYAASLLLTPSQVLQCEEIAKAAFAYPERVRATGATRQPVAIPE